MPDPITTVEKTPDANQTVESNAASSPANPEMAVSVTETNEETVSKKDFNKTYWKQKQTERENEDLKRQLAERASTTHTQTTQETSTGEPKLEQFDYDQDAYTAALVDHRVQQGIRTAFTERDNRSKADREQKEVGKVNQAFNDRYEEYASANPEYQEIAAAAGNKAFAPHINQAVLYAENGPQIDHYLLTHPAEAEKLGGMHPTTAAIEIGKLSAKLNATPKITPSNAPAPIETVGGGGSPTHDVRFDDNVSMEDYYKASMTGKR